MKQIFFDMEWRIDADRRIFLLSYYVNKKVNGFLYGRALNRTNIQKLFKPYDYIFFFGPDVGQILSHYNLDLKTNHYCVNLETAFKRLKPRLKKHSLEHIEKHYHIKRKSKALKNERVNLYNVWRKNPKAVLEYAFEDSYNLMLVYYKLKAEKNLQRKDFLKYLLKTK